MWRVAHLVVGYMRYAQVPREMSKCRGRAGLSTHNEHLRRRG
jgi:hypothetical protein